MGKLRCELEAFCRSVAPELADGPLCVVLDGELSPELRSDRGTLGWTRPYLGDVLRPELERLGRRRGRGPAVVLNLAAFVTADAAIVGLEKSLGPRLAVWVYEDTRGEPVGAVARWDGLDGKEIRPVSRRSDGVWVIGAMPAPRPLYRLPELRAERRSPADHAGGQDQGLAVRQGPAGPGTAGVRGQSQVRRLSAAPPLAGHPGTRGLRAVPLEALPVAVGCGPAGPAALQPDGAACEAVARAGDVSSIT